MDRREGNPASIEGLHLLSDKRRASNRLWRANNQERVKENRRIYHLNNRDKECARNKEYRTENAAIYAIRRNESRWIKRGLPAPTRPRTELCECCGKGQSRKLLALDHCHETGKFRGWLCSNCNSGLAFLGDTIEGVKKMVAYLEKI